MDIMSTPEVLVAEQVPAVEEQLTSTAAEQGVLPDEVALSEEIEEELIIEDFTIDGICGVY